MSTLKTKQAHPKEDPIVEVAEKGQRTEKIENLWDSIQVLSV